MAQRDRTKHARGTLNPKWADEEFLYLLDDPSAQSLRVAVRAPLACPPARLLAAARGAIDPLDRPARLHTLAAVSVRPCPQVKAWEPSGSVDSHSLMGETSIALDDLERALAPFLPPLSAAAPLRDASAERQPPST